MRAWYDVYSGTLLRVDGEREVHAVWGVCDGYGAAWLDDDDRCHLRVTSPWHECLSERRVALDVPSIFDP